MNTLLRQEGNGDSRAPSNSSTQSPLAVVIVTYNSASVLKGLLDSLPSGLEGIDNYDVYVVDNDSRDNSIALAEAHPIGVKIIRTGRNAGYAAGINAAVARVADDTDILVLNPDIRLRRGCVLHLSNRLREPSVGIAVPRILNEDETLAMSLRRQPTLATGWSDALLGTKIAARIGLGEIVDDPDLYRNGGSADWATGAVLAVSARARRLVGEWDESFFLYSEEVDYMERVRREGMRIVYDVDACAVHFGGEYHENTFLSALMTANRIRYYRRHHGPVSTVLFRLAIIVGETMRFALSPGHRAAFWAALSPARYPAAPARREAPISSS